MNAAPSLMSYISIGGVMLMKLFERATVVKFGNPVTLQS